MFCGNNVLYNYFPVTQFFYMSNLVAKAAGLNLGEKISNLLSSPGALN